MFLFLYGTPSTISQFLHCREDDLWVSTGGIVAWVCEPAHLIFAKRGNTLTGTPSEMPFWPLKDGKEGLNSIWMLHIWTYNFTIMPILHEWVTWS